MNRLPAIVGGLILGRSIDGTCSSASSPQSPPCEGGESQEDEVRDTSFPDSGIYQLLIHVSLPLTIHIGALGEHRFAAGWYVYTGSMRRGLSHRLRRHAARDKPLRWHIDYLTCAAGVVAARSVPLSGDRDQECRTHRRLAAEPGVSIPVRGFGSSDCCCDSHLVYLGALRDIWDCEGTDHG